MAKNGTVNIGNTQMHYAEFGSGERNLVVLPGLSDGLTTVKGKAWMLAPSYKKFLKDFKVYMFSRKESMPEGYSIRDMAKDQVEAMRILNITKATVMGVSQGGMISQYIAADYPEVVEKLILVVTAPYANEVARDAVSTWMDMAKRGDHTTLMIDTAERMYSKAYLDKNRKLFPVIAKFTRPSSYERFLRNAEAILKFDARDDLKNITCPTLIISGDDDKTVGNDAPAEFNAGITNSEVYIYEGQGHGLFDEEKDFYDRVLEYALR